MAAGGDPEKAGYLDWEQVRVQLAADDAQE
jgi:hypothetical protein